MKTEKTVEQVVSELSCAEYEALTALDMHTYRKIILMHVNNIRKNLDGVRTDEKDKVSLNKYNPCKSYALVLDPYGDKIAEELKTLRAHNEEEFLKRLEFYNIVVKNLIKQGYYVIAQDVGNKMVMQIDYYYQDKGIKGGKKNNKIWVSLTHFTGSYIKFADSEISIRFRDPKKGIDEIHQNNVEQFKRKYKTNPKTGSVLQIFTLLDRELSNLNDRFSKGLVTHKSLKASKNIFLRLIDEIDNRKMKAGLSIKPSKIKKITRQDANRINFVCELYNALKSNPKNEDSYLMAFAILDYLRNNPLIKDEKADHLMVVAADCMSQITKPAKKTKDAVFEIQKYVASHKPKKVSEETIKEVNEILSGLSYAQSTSSKKHRFVTTKTTEPQKEEIISLDALKRNLDHFKTEQDDKINTSTKNHINRLIRVIKKRQDDKNNKAAIDKQLTDNKTKIKATDEQVANAMRYAIVQDQAIPAADKQKILELFNPAAPAPEPVVPSTPDNEERLEERLSISDKSCSMLITPPDSPTTIPETPPEPDSELSI
jgi:hypothetical protein